MNDVVLAILEATEQVTIAAMYGSTGAGGVMMALATDRVFARDGIVLNPHYKGMGGLYGSEYWTYTLPKRVGPALARKLTEECAPISVQESRSIGLIDDVLIQDNYGVNNFEQFEDQIRRIAARFVAQEKLTGLSKLKTAIRAADEQRKPLAQYRREELEEMKRNFWGEDRSYHLARSAFVRKRPGRAGRSAIRCWNSAATSHQAAAPERTAPGPHPGPSYAQSRAVRELYLARLVKLDYEERTGKLVDAAEVAKAAFDDSCVTGC